MSSHNGGIKHVHLLLGKQSVPGLHEANNNSSVFLTRPQLPFRSHYRRLLAMLINFYMICAYPPPCATEAATIHSAPVLRRRRNPWVLHSRVTAIWLADAEAETIVEDGVGTAAVRHKIESLRKLHRRVVFDRQVACVDV